MAREPKGYNLHKPITVNICACEEIRSTLEKARSSLDFDILELRAQQIYNKSFSGNDPQLTGILLFQDRETENFTYDDIEKAFEYLNVYLAYSIWDVIRAQHNITALRWLLWPENMQLARV